MGPTAAFIFVFSSIFGLQYNGHIGYYWQSNNLDLCQMRHQRLLCLDISIIKTASPCHISVAALMVRYCLAFSLEIVLRYLLFLPRLWDLHLTRLCVLTVLMMDRMTIYLFHERISCLFFAGDRKPPGPLSKHQHEALSVHGLSLPTSAS